MTNEDTKVDIANEETKCDENKKDEDLGEKAEAPKNEPLKKEKKNKYKEQVEKLEAELKVQRNEYLKVFAEMENTKKRLKEEAIKDRKYSSYKVVSELINPIDMFIKIINMPAPSPEIQNYVIGFKMIANQIVDIMKNEGLSEIHASKGDEFDPKVMQAVSKEEVIDEEANKVLEVMQTGYLYKDRVIRPAMVKVSVLKKEEVKIESNEKSEIKENE